MFGIYRYCLALMVVADHVGQLNYWLGPYAVFAFFLLSGYLMSLVLNNSYGFQLDGLRRFAINRFLRIYPPYFAVLALSVVAISLDPAVAVTLNPALTVPDTLREWLGNLTIVGLKSLSTSRLVPPAWSLQVELVYYVAMALLLTRQRLITLGWFGLSLAYTAALVIGGAHWNDRYAETAAGALPFSIGALLSFSGPRLVGRLHLPLAAAAFAVNATFANQLWAGDVLGRGFYVSLLLSWYLTAALRTLDPATVRPAIRKLDHTLGNLAYPIFLCHWPVATLVGAVVFDEPRGSSPEILLWSIGAVHLVAYAVHVLVERPINRLRGTIRQTRQPLPAA